MEERICPKCGKKYIEFPALSRDDNETEICPQCGLIEALQSWDKFRQAQETE